MLSGLLLLSGLRLPDLHHVERCQGLAPARARLKEIILQVGVRRQGQDTHTGVLSREPTVCRALSSIECHMEGEAVTPEEEETEAQIRSHLFKWTYLLRELSGTSHILLRLPQS